jgi:hypothetical protein
MQSTDYQRCEERLRLISALPIPRPIEPGPRFWIGFGLYGGAMVVGLLIFYLKGYPIINVSSWGPGRTLAVVAVSIYVGISSWWSHRQIRLLARGTPVIGKVLARVRIERYTRIKYCYETFPGAVLFGRADIIRAGDEVEGSPIIVCYDTNNHEKSMAIDYSIWKIKIPD